MSFRPRRPRDRAACAKYALERKRADAKDCSKTPQRAPKCQTWVQIVKVMDGPS